MLAEIAFLSILGIMSLCALVTARGYPVFAFDHSGGPGLFPALVALLLLLSCLGRIVQILLCRKKGSADSQPFGLKSLFGGPRGVFVGLTFVYIFGFRYLGFLTSTLIYVNVLVQLIVYWQNKALGSAGKVTLRVLACSAAVVLLYFSFTKGFQLPLPTWSL